MRNKLMSVILVASVGVLAYMLTSEGPPPVQRETVERETAGVESRDKSRNSAVYVKYEGGYWYSR